MVSADGAAFFAASLPLRVVRGIPRRLVLLLLGLGLLRRPCRALTFLDQPLDLLPALAADLLVEVRSAGGFDPVAALFPDLLVELGPPLRLDRLAPFASDFLVEVTAALVADGLSPLPTGLGHRHASFVVLLSHWLSSSNDVPPACNWVRSAWMQARPESSSQSRPARSVS